MKKLIYSGAGLLLIAVAFLAFNLLAGLGLGGARLDLTEQKLYTISDGTKQILAELDEPINLYFFYSDKVAKNLPALRTYAQRVEEMLKAYQAQAGGKIRLHIIDPEPFSEDEDKAAEFGLQGIPLQQGGDAIYFGLAGTNSLSVELSSIPAIDLGRRLKYLIEYPYGCVEQTISAAFPQLYLSQVMECDENTVARSARNVTAAINRLHSFRRPDGSLSYWPGSTASSSFGSAYALHFLQEAENQGYAVPADLKSGIIRYLTGSVVSNKKEDEFVRAYGLY
ncbi:MAG: Gldg family protein, partial [Pseudomonas sp.]|nr:Gldg family protein [Pseudomonas sp.]